MIYILFLALAIAFALNSWLLKNNREITDIHTKLLKILQTSEKFQDKEIIQILGKLEKLEKSCSWTNAKNSQNADKGSSPNMANKIEWAKRIVFLEKKIIEMRTNFCLQNRRIDKIFLEKFSQDDFTEFEKKFALEIEKFRSNFEKITKAQARRIWIIERKVGIAKKIELPNNENIF